MVTLPALLVPSRLLELQLPHLVVYLVIMEAPLNRQDLDLVNQIHLHLALVQMSVRLALVCLVTRVQHSGAIAVPPPRAACLGIPDQIVVHLVRLLRAVE